MYYSEELNLPKTDPTRWLLKTDKLGRETWHYEDNADTPAKQTNFVKWLLKVDSFPTPKYEYPIAANHPKYSAIDSAKRGADFFSLLQDENSGIFPCQYKGPMFMMIGYVTSCLYTGTEIPTPFKTEMIRYIVNNSHPVDGGWGLHSSDKLTCFGTSMNYVCLRLLGLEADHPVCVKARKTLHRLGGALGNPHWGKAWLSILNIYEWEGVNPAPPELWLMPYDSFPIHPGRWWVHTRAIYLPLSYISTNKLKCELTPLLSELRTEIYVQDYSSINFANHRNTVCGVDLYYPHTKLLDAMNWSLVKYGDCLRPNWVLEKSNKKVYELIEMECKNTDYLCIAPINFAFNMIVTYHREGPNSQAFDRFKDRMNDVVFHGPQGMCVMGTNGVQVWDVAFMVQYFFMAGLAEDPKYYDTIVRGFKFLIRSQFDTECVPGSMRDKRIGGWPFSTKDQGYTVSDCTAEAMKAIIMVGNHPKYAHLKKEYVVDENLYEAVDVILNIQNKSSFEFGSFSSYEKIRATPLLEKLNPAEVFNNIMVEYPYVECTDSSVLGLTYFAKYYPEHRKYEIKDAIRNAIQYITESQDPHDGSWYGCWGVCFTYASMFALEAYHSVGQNYSNSEPVRKGCDFLVSKQREDGGWSESMKSCETHTYVSLEKSLVVQTAWALIGLILSAYPDRAPIERGIELLISRQLPSGEWKFEEIEGVFNHSCAIEYPNYRFLFPIKALGLYHQLYGAN